MKILLLLVLKCLTYTKISADQNYESQWRDIISAQTSLLVEGSKQIHVRVKRDSLTNVFLAFEPEDLTRSQRHKREVRNQNQIFFRRRKKKLYRQSKIRRSLLRRGRFTTGTPYHYLKKYANGKNKMIRPPGLKYRKKYRFNRFKKTQDVALGIGEGGRAKVLQSPPKKRPPIHVRDYDRGRGTRKALRGRVGERASDRFRKGADTNRNRAGGGGGNRRATFKKSEKQYYDEMSDYSSELAKDSLPKQTKARKVYSTFGRITKTYPWGNNTNRKKATKSALKHSAIDGSRDDNTLLLSDEEQLTDISSDISELRSELSDERPKHRKNVSSSEYEQYSYAEDDSAIVSGQVLASKDSSSPLKTTLLGPINYDQYDIKKLDASVERVFKKSKQQKAGMEYDDPFEDIQDGYKDETSYESSSNTKHHKQKKQKSKPKLEKRPEKIKNQPKTGRELKAKLEKKQTPNAKLKKNAAKSDSYGDAEHYNIKSKKQKEQLESKSYSDGSDSYEDAEHYDSESEEGEVSDYEDESKQENDSDEEYTSDEEYASDEDYTYEEVSTPKRRIPTWRFTQNPKQEKLYEEYTDTEDQNNNPKLNLDSKKAYKTLSSKALFKKEFPSKKGDESSIHEYEEYDSEHSNSRCQDQKGKMSTKQESIATKNVKITTKKSITTKRTDTSDYESDYNSDRYSDTDTSSKHEPNEHTMKKSSIKSGKMAKKVTSDEKMMEKGTKYEEYMDASTYDEYSSDSINDKKASKKTMKNLEKVPTCKIGSDISTYDEYKEYKSYSDEKKTSAQTSEKLPKPSSTKKITTAKNNLKTKKIKKILMRQSNEYNSENLNKESLHSEKTSKKKNKFNLDQNTMKLSETFTPLPIKKTKSKSNKVVYSKNTIEHFKTTKSSGKTSKKKSIPIEKSLEMYEDSEYDSQVTSYEDTSENNIVHEKNSIEHANQTLYNDLEENGGSAELNKESAYHSNLNYDDLKSTKSTLIRKTKSAQSTLKRIKKGFTTLATTIKEFNSEEALKKISSKAAALTQNYAFVYNTKRKAYELVTLEPTQDKLLVVSLQSTSSATLEVTRSNKDPPTFSKTTFATTFHSSNSSKTIPETNLYSSDNRATSHLSKKTFKKRIIRKKTTSVASDNSTHHISVVHSRIQQSGQEDQTKKISRKKSTSTKSNNTQKRSLKKTTRS